MITMRTKRGLSGIRVWHIAMLVFMLFFIAIAPPLAQAQVPRYINYQGKLTDANDDPVTGDVSITIRIYDVESGGTALWTEVQKTTVTRGIFSILLGNVAKLDEMDFNKPYWYSVEVESDKEMTPRQRLTSVAYAINSDKLDGYDASDFLRGNADATLTGNLTVAGGSITGGANEDVTIDPTGIGNIVMKIDSTSKDFKITDGTTNWFLVDHTTGNVTIAKDLTVGGTIYGTIASTGGNSTFSNIVVTGTSDMRGNISNSSGAVTIADAITQTGAANQVTFAGNVDAGNGLDVTGALTVNGLTTLNSAASVNSNLNVIYSGSSPALSVTQNSTGPAAQFSGQRVVVGSNELTNTNALSSGELYVQGDMQVDGTIYGNLSSSGTTALGDATLASLTVTGASDLKGNISNSTGTVTVADNLAVTKTDSSTLGTAILVAIQPVFQDGGTNSSTAAIGLNVNPTINYTGASKTGSYTALKIAATETSLPVGANYLINATAGADGTAQKFYVDNSGNALFAGTVTAALSPVAPSDLTNKAYVDSITPVSAGGWTDGGTGIYLTEAADNVGIGTSTTDTYKLNVSGSANVTTLDIGGVPFTANLTTLTNGSNADSLHTHAVGSLVGNVVSSVDGVTNNGGNIDLVAGANMTITPNNVAKTITFASQASGDEVSTTSHTFTLDSNNAGLGAENGTGLIIKGGTGSDISIKFNSAANNLDVAGVTGGINIPTGANYKINGSQIASSNLSDSANIPKLDEAGTITGDWVNTAHPWADNEVADNLTISGGTVNNSVIGGSTPAAGTFTTLASTTLLNAKQISASHSLGATGTLDKDTVEVARVFDDTGASDILSGNVMNISNNVTVDNGGSDATNVLMLTQSPDSAGNLIYGKQGAAEKFTVDKDGMIKTASVNSASIKDGSITKDDLGVNVVSSLNSVINHGGNINLVAGSNVTITPDADAKTITIASSYIDTVLSQEQVEDYAGALIAAGTKTNLSVTYQDNGGSPGAIDMAVTGVPVLAPASTQTITAAAVDAKPLVLKGMAGQTASLMEVQDSSALSHLTVTKDGDVQIDTSGGDALSSITQSNASASLAVATNISKLGGGAGSDSDGVLKLGINEGNYQYIWYDTDAGTDGLGAFIFSDQAVIPTASPAYLNFGVDKDAATGRYNQYYAIKLDPDVANDLSYSKQKFSVVSIPNPGPNWQKSEKPLFDVASDGSFNIYDPTVGDAVFQIEPGGRLAHDFRNIIKNGSFEAFSGFETFIGSGAAGTYNTGYTTSGYRGGWDNFAPDEWTWISGRVVQHSPALFKTSGQTGTFNTDFYDGKSAVAINEPSGTRGSTSDKVYTFGAPKSGKDAVIQQSIKGLQPDTWYSIGVALMSTNPTTTKAILDITGYDIPTTSITSGISQSATLNGSSSSTILVADTSDFPRGGTMLIGNELFGYTSKTDTSFSGVTRGINSTVAAEHTNNDVVSGVFRPLISSSSAFVENKGSFKTDATGSDINVYLICQQTSGASDTDFARFDAIQLVEGKVLPKYGPTSIVDTGDQSIYGTLKLGRSADGRGGILSVDQFVRTRGVDFFSEDPGVSGAGGGSGIVGAPYSVLNFYGTNYAPGTVFMSTTGNYIESLSRKFQAKIEGSYSSPSSYVRYRYQECIDPLREDLESSWGYGGTAGNWSPWSSATFAVSTSETALMYGIKIKFSDATAWNGTVGNPGYRGGDRWEFIAHGMTAGRETYDSYNQNASYMPSATRIFRDTTTGELTFEDSKAGKVRLSQIISQRSTGYISPPTRDPSNTGTLSILASGELSGSVVSTGRTFEVMLEYNASGEPVKYSWHTVYDPNNANADHYHNWGQDITGRNIDLSLICDNYSTSPNADTGIKIQFPTGTLCNYERWTFYASPGSAANLASHHHANAGDGGVLGAPGTTSQNFAIASASDPAINDIKLAFGNAVSPNDRFITWNKTLSQFDVSNNMNIAGTLTAANLSGPTSTSGTSNATFGVNTGLGVGATEPAQGSGYIIAGGGAGNVNITYDATGNYLNITGQAGAINTFTGINIPAGTKYKIGAANLTASDVGAANLSHSHAAADLPTAGAGTAGIIPVGGLTNAMVSGTAALQTSKLQDGAGISDAITKKHTQGTDTTLGAMAADIQMNGNKVIGLGVPTIGADAATKTYVDNAIAGLHWKDPVTAIQTAPPVGPTAGARYIVNPAGTGAWNGQDNKIAVYNGSTWDFTAPLQSYAVFNKADNAGYVYNGSAWVAFSGATAYTWGTGLTNSGTTISVDNTVVATLSGSQVLTNKTISGANNTIQSISDGSLNQITTANKVAGTAVQLNAGGAITNNSGLQVNLSATNPGLAITNNALDVKLTANQGVTKTADGMQVDYDNTTIGIVGNKLAVKAGSITGGQIADSSITSAKILDGTIVNADIADNAAIAQSKLASLVIANSEVAANAAIAWSKINKTGAIASEVGAAPSVHVHSGVDITSGTVAAPYLPTAGANTAGIIPSTGATNAMVAANANIATSKISGAVNLIMNNGLGNLAFIDTVSGGAGGTISDDTITNADIKSDAAIATSKLSGPVTSIANNGLGTLATLNAVTSATITDGTITSADISGTAGILDSQLATSPAVRFYENFAEYVETGLQPALSANLTSDISLGTAYVRGVRINKSGVTSKTYTASKDTYVDIDSSGNFQYTAVGNGAAVPAVAANSIRLAKVVTGPGSITGVTDLRNLYPVTANEIAPGAVTSIGIEDGSIGTSKLADSAVTSIKIADGAIVNADISDTSAIAWSKISKSGAAASDVGAAATSHVHAGSDITSGTVVSTYLPTAAANTAGIIPSTGLTNAMVSSSAAISGAKISANFGTQNLTVSGAITAAADTTASDSDGILYLGKDNNSSHYLMWDDSYQGLDSNGNTVTGWMYTDSGMSVKNLEIRGASPATITFGSGVTSKQLQFNAATQEFSFTGGKLKQAFQNLVRSGDFESYRPSGWDSYNSNYYTDNTVYKFGNQSLRIQDTSAVTTSFMRYYVGNWDRLKGGNVTLAVWARCDTGKTATASIGIGTDSNNDATAITNISLTDTWQNFTATYVVPLNATNLKVYLYASAGASGIPSASTRTSDGGGAAYVYYDGITLVDGKLALDYGPSPVFDTGDQVISGNLAIGASIDPYNSYGTNYYNYPRLVFGEPDSYFGGSYGYYSMGSGELSFRSMSGSSATFNFNRPIAVDSGYVSGWNNPGLFIGNKYSTPVDNPDYAWSSNDAYIKGVLEVDSGIYGDIMSFSGGVGKTNNLLKYSEDFTQSDWIKSSGNMQVTAGQTAPDGTAAACKLTNINSSVESVTQTYTSASPNTMYTFSVYLAKDTQTYAYIYLKTNLDSYWQVCKYADLYSSTNWRRFSTTYTTPSGAVTTITAKIEFYGGSSGYNSIKAWGAQLRQSSGPGIYLKTTSSPIANSASLFYGDGSGLTNLPASSIASGTAAITGISGNTFTINEDLAGAPTDNLSIAFNRGNQADAALAWDESSDKFVFNNPVNISNGNLAVAGAIVAGSGANQITTASGLLDATKLYGAVPVANLPSDGYASTYVNVTGDTMTGALNLATLAAATGNNLNIKLGDAAGTNTLSIQTSAGAEKFSVSSNGAVKIDGGYTGTAGGGITLQPNGDIYFDGNLYQTGNIYQVDTIRFTGNYNVGMVAKFGVGADGTDANYLQIDNEGVITKAGSANGGAVTVDDLFTQTGSANQVTFQGNVDALNGLDVTGNITLGAGGTVDGIDISSDGWVTSAKILDGAVVDADVNAAAAIAGTKISPNFGSQNIITTGNIGIGTTGPGSRLAVSGGAVFGSSYTGTAMSDGNVAISGNVGIGTTTPGSRLEAVSALSAATGNETAYKLAYTTNKATSGNDTGLLISMTDTLSPGASLPLDIQVGGASKFNVDNTGTMTTQALTIGSTALTSSTPGSEGATLVGAKTGYTNISLPGAANVQAVLNAIDSTLGVISGGTGSFTNLTVTGTSDLRGNISNSTGALTIADALTQTGSGNQVAFAGNVDAQNGLDVTGNITATGSISTSSNILTTGAGMMTSAGLMTAAAGINVSGGNIAITDSSNIVLNTNKIMLYGSTGNMTLAGSLTQLRSIGLTPDYDNAALNPDGTDNFGTLTLKYASSHNYYEWTTSEPATQDYDIVIRYRLPDGFTSFAAAPIKLWNRVSAVPGATKVDVSMLDTAGEPVTLSNGSALQNTSWTESTINITGSPVFTAGGYVTITIKLSADQGKTADAGELTLRGNW